MQRPTGPSIEPSDPEKEQQEYEAIKRLIKSNSVPKIISLPQARDSLLNSDLDIDENGFIIDESGEFVEPYAFSKEKFEEIPSPVDDPINEYFIPEYEIDLIGAKNKVHLSDMHSVYRFDDGMHPIRDNEINLIQFLEYTGFTFTVVTGWSNALHLVERAEAKPIQIKVEPENPVDLTCFECGFTGEVTEWEGDVDKDKRCPNCGRLWKTYGTEQCENCGTDNRWEDITGDDEEKVDMYWEPYCEKCGSGHEELTLITRYTEVESSTPTYD